MGIIFFIIAVFGFGILVFFHELGHFLMGKLFKIKIETFSVGMGPAIFGFKKGETFYQVGAVPFGGFCKFKGEETFEDLPVKFTINVFEDIKGKIKTDSTKNLLLNNYDLRIPEEILKEDFEKTLKITTKKSDLDLLNESYEFDSSKDVFKLKEMDDEKSKKLIKIFNDNNADLLKYYIKSDISEKDKKNILKTVTSEIKIYKLRDPDSFYGVAPYKRLFVVLFGPLMNYIIAVIFLSILAMFSHKDYYEPNKIMLIDDVYLRSETEISPAKKAGLKTGDIIIEIDNKKVTSFNEIFENIYNKKDNVKILIKRDGREIMNDVKPEWDPKNLKYYIGIYSYLDPVIKNSANNKLQKELGLLDNDKIMGIDNNFENWSVLNVQNFLVKNFASNKKSIIHVERNSKIIDIPIVFNEINHKVSENEFFFEFNVPEQIIEGESVIRSFITGFNKSNKIIEITANGLYSLIFKPKKDVMNQFGSPLIIGYFIGKFTVEGLKDNIYTGIRNFFEFISMISLGLAFFNLLPIPALDGGYIILNIYEIIFRRSISLKVLYKVTMIFFIILLVLMSIFVFMDIPKIINFEK